MLKKFVMLKFVINLTLLLPVISRASELPYYFENIAPSSVVKNSNFSVTIQEYYYRSPPHLTFAKPSEITKCILNNNICDPQKGFDLIVPPGIHDKVYFTLNFVMSGVLQSHKVQLLSDDFPAYEVKGLSKLGKSIFLTPEVKALVISSTGEIQYFRKFPYYIEDFKPHLIGNKTYYSFLKIKHINVGLNEEGERVIFDDKMHEIKTLPYLMDMHSFTMFNLKHFIFTEYKKSQTFGGNCFIDKVVKEIDNDKLVFSISSSELIRHIFLHLGPNQFKMGQESCSEILHFNQLQALSNNRILIGLGGDGVMVINKKNKKPEWIFSGIEDQFFLPKEINPGLTHTPTFDEERSILLLFDNTGYQGSSNHSRILEYQLDIKNKKIKQFKIIPAAKFLSKTMGSVEKEDDIYSIGTGEKNMSAPDFIEVFNNSPTFELRFTGNRTNLHSYRAYRSIF